MKNIISLIVVCFFCASAFAEDNIHSWDGTYRGVCVYTAQDGTEKEVPFDLEIGRTGSPGTFFIKNEANSISISVRNLEQRKRKGIAVPQLSKEQFYIPAIFAEPISIEAHRVKGGFNEELIEGEVKIYKISMDNEPELESVVRFKAGRT
ncbi:hypothetical protein [Rubellicoccus peritrichatus]|uniref:Uncharacterized protein n=1 Tax=Rubellicoccus peritrichatus TaxID=3080537 RepID=A0AAQ3LAF0_9BACT|nr:hypothetical protein [Puniceicoccus sp. CR14]WOO41637.1 hypothetical protein RZN69_00955 [Puniceicoccus sp. CR14]